MHTLTLRKLLAFSAILGIIGSVGTTSILAQGAPQGQGRGQGGGGRQGGRQMSLASLPVATLDSIVKLTPAQKTKITPIHDNYVKQMTALRPQQGQQPAPDAMQKWRDLGTQTSKSIEDLLTPAQKTKLADARKEMGMYRMAGIPTGLYGQIKLTADQKTKLQELQKSMTPAQGSMDRTAMRTAMQAGREKAAALLTPAQKTQIEKYRKDHPQEQFGGRGQGGGFGRQGQRGGSPRP